MAKKSPRSGSPIVQEHAEDAPVGWKETQESLAAGAGLSLLLVDGRQPPAIAVSNNNSICEAFQSSPEHVKLCDPYCGDAHRRAMSAGTTVEYKCHAGLQCFAQPVNIGERELAVIGGRAFLKSSDYQTLMERFRAGDLQDLDSADLFNNIVFADAERLQELSERVTKAANKAQISRPQNSKSAKTAREDELPERQDELELEVARLKSELEYRARFADSLQHFLERISSDDPAKTYESILANSRELLKSERASLLVFDEAANQLVAGKRPHRQDDGEAGDEDPTDRRASRGASQRRHRLRSPVTRASPRRMGTAVRAVARSSLPALLLLGEGDPLCHDLTAARANTGLVVAPAGVVRRPQRLRQFGLRDEEVAVGTVLCPSLKRVGIDVGRVRVAGVVGIHHAAVLFSVSGHVSPSASTRLRQPSTSEQRGMAEYLSGSGSFHSTRATRTCGPSMPQRRHAW